MRIKKNDNIIVISGKDRGRKAKVLKVLPKQNKAVIQGLNIIKKHRKARKQGEKGQVVEIPAPIHISNLKVICGKCGKATRLGYKIIENKKYRICKKCKAEI